MTTQQIYDQFLIPKNLQEHMLRVAALAEIIGEHWQAEKIDLNSIVQACLLHDIAKPLTFDPAKQAQFGASETEIGRLTELQAMIRSTYSANEHEASVKICQKVGCSPAAVEIVDDLEWEYIDRWLVVDKVRSLIAIYCDMRIGPQRILPLVTRINDLKTRDPDPARLDQISLDGQRLETRLHKIISLDLNSITEEQIEARWANLRNYSFGSN